jgi:hypothetical protein
MGVAPVLMILSNAYRHQFLRIAADIKELQSRILNKILEILMGCEPNPMAILA